MININAYRVRENVAFNGFRNTYIFPNGYGASVVRNDLSQQKLIVQVHNLNNDVVDTINVNDESQINSVLIRIAEYACLQPETKFIFRHPNIMFS